MSRSGHWRDHVSTGERVPKRHYSRAEAVERAAKMTEDYGQPYHVYPCLACGGRHIGRPNANPRHRIVSQRGSSIRLPRNLFDADTELGPRVAAHLAWENSHDPKIRRKAIRQRVKVALGRLAARSA